MVREFLEKMVTGKAVLAKANFIGEKSSLGFINGQSYLLRIQNKEKFVKVYELIDDNICFYSNAKDLLDNWEIQEVFNWLY